MIARRRCIDLLAAALLTPAMAKAAEGWDPRGPDVPDVTLVDQDGRRWRLRDIIRARPAVAVGFFFSGCTTLCPPQTAALQALQEVLAARADAAAPASPLLLAITLDPFGDTPAAMRAYAARFELSLGLEQGWLMLSGDLRALARVWDAFDAPGGRPEQHAATLWIGRDGGRRWQSTPALDPTEQIADLLLPRELAR